MIHQMGVRYLLSILTLAFVLVPASDPTLEDWKIAQRAAQDGKGCESIPYSSYRDQCTRKSERVFELCKTTAWSCEGLQTRALREDIKGLSEHIDRLKQEKDRLNTQRSSASSDSEKTDIGKKIEEVEKQIYDKTKTLDDMKRRLELDLREIENRLYTGRQCLDARSDVQSIFQNASSDANRVNDPAIKPIANDQIDYWSRKRQEHQRMFDAVKEGIDKCNRCKSGDL